MSDEQQRSLSGYKSKVRPQTDFKNPNEGKPILNDSDEYIFTLIKEPHIIRRQETRKNKNTNGETKFMVDKAVCDFEERETKNIVPVFFRVDSLNFAKKVEDEPYESAIVKFFKKIKAPLPEDPEVELDKYLVVGMRFRSRVVVKPETVDGVTTTRYFMDLPTVRKLLPSDTAREDFGTTTSDAPQTAASVDSVAKAKIIIVGCADSTTAYQRLLEAKAQPDIIQAFVAADKRGEIAYPVQ